MRAKKFYVRISLSVNSQISAMSDVAGAFAKLRKAIIGFVVSVRLLVATRLPLDGVICTSVERIQVLLTSDRSSGTLHEDRCTFMVTSRWILFRMRKFSDESFTENQNTHFMFSNLFFP